MENSLFVYLIPVFCILISHEYAKICSSYINRAESKLSMCKIEPSPSPKSLSRRENSRELGNVSSTE